MSRRCCRATQLLLARIVRVPPRPLLGGIFLQRCALYITPPHPNLTPPLPRPTAPSHFSSPHHPTRALSACHSRALSPHRSCTPPPLGTPSVAQRRLDVWTVAHFQRIFNAFSTQYPSPVQPPPAPLPLSASNPSSPTPLRLPLTQM